MNVVEIPPFSQLCNHGADYFAHHRLTGQIVINSNNVRNRPLKRTNISSYLLVLHSNIKLQPPISVFGI